MKNRRIAAGLAGLSVAALALSACSDTSSGAEPSPTITVTAPPAAPTSEPTIIDPAPTTSLTPRPDGPPILGFGEAFDYSDGITVNVQNLGVQPATDYSGAVTNNVVLELAITNNSGAAFDPTTADGTLTYGTMGLEAEETFDLDRGWGGTYFVGTLLPGRTATITTAYDIPPESTGDLVYEFTPEWADWERGPVIYVSNPPQ